MADDETTRQPEAESTGNPAGASASPKTDSGRRPLYMLGFTLLALLVAGLFISGFRSYHELLRAQSRSEQLAQEIAETEESVARLERTRERLEADARLLERLAREDLGMVAPEDVVLVLPKVSVRGGDP